MAQRRRPPGEVRDAIIAVLTKRKGDASITEIKKAVKDQLGDVPDSSVRSYLRLNTPALFKRTGRGRYRICKQGMTTKDRHGS
ncbi:MAG: hypothetical protein IH859_00455 [Chloroflexi bacterium]|nr:hypothetical protein [Chloroflexota bacterium]